MKILSGIQPSGQLHIGNYFGMMLPMIRNMEKGELYAFIVNLHALTSVHDPKKLAGGTLEAAADFIALGLDPDRCIFWVQGDVPEVTELTWILSTLTAMGLLERCHSYKDKVAKGIAPSHGLFSYPVLMAADILLYVFGETFVIPEPAIEESVATVPGIDGQKMSKSYGNTIPIFSAGKQLKKQVMAIQTDSTPVEEPKDPDACNLYNIFKLFAPADRLAEVRDLYVKGGAAYGYIKLELVTLIEEYFKAARLKRAELLQDKESLKKILVHGALKAREKAAPTLDLVRQRVGLKY
jgi:tryptophanyl-tRNA synthetase